MTGPRLFCNIGEAAQLIGRSRDVVRDAMTDTESAKLTTGEFNEP